MIGPGGSTRVHTTHVTGHPGRRAGDVMKACGARFGGLAG